jgi:hypothetical protein
MRRHTANTDPEEARIVEGFVQRAVLRQPETSHDPDTRREIRRSWHV